MEPEEKNQFDSLATLWQGAWNQFNERRRFEFQICLSIWTALAAFTSIMLSKKDSEIEISGTVCAFALVVLLALDFLFWFWIKELRKRNDLDKSIALHYETKMQGISNSSFDPLGDIEKMKKQIQSSESIFSTWSHGIQIYITILFSICAFFSLFLKLKS